MVYPSQCRPSQTRALAVSAATRPIFESLEYRQLLSVSVNDGVLDIGGTSGADEVHIRPGRAGHLRVNANGERHYFKAADVTEIRFSGGGGDDALIIQEFGGKVDVDVLARGGSGNDMIVTGYGDDSLHGGEGDDTLIAGKGNNLLIGDGGNDFLSAKSGDDRLFGRAGDDELSNGGGKDVTAGGEGDDLLNPIRAHFPVIDSFTPEPAGYDVRQMRNAYGFGDVKNSTWTGRGQAIAIVGVYTLPTAQRDLNIFSREMGIPTLKGKQLRIVNLAPRKRQLFDEDWNFEAMLDLQWAHAIAPQAKIYMVQAATNAASDVTAAIVRAQRILSNNHGGGVVSMSLGRALDRDIDRVQDSVFRGANNRYISYIAASGDVGGESIYPAHSPNVTAVGGTTLYLDDFGNRVPGATRTDVFTFGEDNLNPLNGPLPNWAGDLDVPATSIPGGERAWWDGGGGASQVFPIPRYQQNRGIPGNQRAVPDVAWNADPRTGVSVYNSAGFGGQAGWATVGGTSAGTPQFAGLVAIVNQLRKKDGFRPVGNTLNDRIYRLGGRGNDNYFNDITVGGSGATTAMGAPFVFPAGTGWDPATGWGTPNAQALVPALVNDGISSGQPSGRVPVFQSRITIRGVITEDAQNAGAFDTLSFSGQTFAAGSATITVQALTVTQIFRATGAGTGLALVDIFGMDETTGVPLANTWEFFELGGGIAQQRIQQGSGTPFTLFRNGDQVTGYAYITISDIPLDPMITVPTEVMPAADTVARHVPVRFVGRIKGNGDIDGDFFAIDAEGNKVKRDFSVGLQAITVTGSFKDS